jgi:hypothetical protein
MDIAREDDSLCSKTQNGIKINTKTVYSRASISITAGGRKDAFFKHFIVA